MISKYKQEKYKSGDQIICEYTMRNESLEVSFLNLGGCITKVALKEDGYKENLILRFNDEKNYLLNSSFQGGIIGRVAGRITDASFLLNDQKYTLEKNIGIHHLHGGKNCFIKRLFDVKEIKDGYQLSIRSEHLEGGYPGCVDVVVAYTLNKNEFLITYKGTSTEDTVLNLTNHTYFNLSGNLKEDVLNHSLQINADSFMEINKDSSPRGNKVSVAGTAFDFKNKKLIKKDLLNDEEQLQYASGYDHAFFLSKEEDCIMLEYDNKSLTVSTNYPSVLFYTGNCLGPREEFQQGVKGRKHLGCCFETQLPPGDIKTMTLKKDEVYDYYTKFRFEKRIT